VPPVEAARLSRLSRYDYAVATGRTAQADVADVAATRTASQAAATAKRKAIRSGTVLAPDRRFDMNVVLDKPLQVSMTMHMSYAADLLRKLRSVKKPRRGRATL
jgi:hypothetical protein